MNSDRFDELVDHWTLFEDERQLIGNKTGSSRLGFALLLRFYILHGRFPRGRAEFEDETIEFVAKQVKVESTDIGFYEWEGRTNRFHKAQIRSHLGFREFVREDAAKFIDWLVTNVCQAERHPEQVTSEFLAHCREERVEPPTDGRMERIVKSALHRAEQLLCERVVSRLGADPCERLEALVSVDTPEADDDKESVLVRIKSDPGAVSLNSLLEEIEKLTAVRAVGVNTRVFSDIAPKVLHGWKSRAAVESPSHLRDHPRQLRLTLLAALLHTRQREITDALVDLFIATVHRIQAHADRRVTQELVNAFKKVTGKENILFAIAEASCDRPDEAVRDVVYPVVNGGEQTLKELVHEYKTKGPVYRRTVQTKLKASYTGHYRQGLIRLLEVLDFRSNNTLHRPVLEALELIERHAAKQRITYYPLGEFVPEHRALTGDWADLVFKNDQRGRQRVQRMAYEIRTFQALREALRCKEIWVAGADRWRNPDEDLPADFESRRAEHYAALRKPLDAAAFINEVQTEMRDELAALDQALPKAKWLDIADRGRMGAIKLSPLDRAPEPANLGKVKAAISRRWGQVALIDMLKEAVLRSGCLARLSTAATRGDLDPEVLAERLMLVIYAYGTNTGIHTVAGSSHGHSEDELRYVRRRYLTPDIAQAMAVEIANATFTAREPGLWGSGSSTVASDSTHFGAYDQNLVTEWHARYGGRGVLIYWHVEQKSMAIHSQLINCSASEVAAMIEGAMHHGTNFDVEGNMVDSHGQSEVGFGVTRLLGFDLLPRIKQINKVKLYRPAAGEADAYPRLIPALTRPIRWDLIETAYDAMIKYATAIKTGTATTEAILRRFMRTPTAHPAYQGMIELGRAQKTIFAARYLRNRDLQRQINAGLNVSEAWNQGNGVIYFGKGGGIASNRRDEQELSVLCLRILQTALVYVNTLMIQHVLADPEWDGVLTETDRRGLTPLFWSHITPYGEVRLDMNHRLSLD